MSTRVPKANGNGKSEPVRPRLSDAVSEAFTPAYLLELAERIKTATTKGLETYAEIKCSGCGQLTRKKLWVQVPDLPKLVTVITDLIEQTEGRPGLADSERGGVTLIVERHWPPPEAKK